MNQTFKSIADYKECMSTERRFKPEKRGEMSDKIGVIEGLPGEPRQR